MWLINICNCVLSPCMCMQLYSGDHRVRCSLSITNKLVEGKSLKRKVQYIQHREWPLTCLPDMVCISIGICKTTTEYFFIYNLLNILQVAEVSHHMDGIASIIFKGKSIIKSVDLA